jgi:hypothetical protein
MAADLETLSLIGQYLLDNDKKEWSDVLKEFILLYQGMYSSDEDADYSDSEGSAIDEGVPDHTIDENGFYSLT